LLNSVTLSELALPFGLAQIFSEQTQSQHLFLLVFLRWYC